MRSSTSVLFAGLFLTCTSVCLAQFNLEPTGTKSDDLTAAQLDSVATPLKAQKAAWRLDGGMVRAYSRMAVPSKDLPVLRLPVAISAPFSTRDVPGGTLFVVRLEKDKNGLSFRADGEGQNEPLTKYVVARTTDLPSAKIESGIGFTLDASLKLKPGYYAIAMLNNQYVWPFEIQ